MASSRKNDENKRVAPPPKQTDDSSGENQALPTITARSGNVNFGYSDPSTTTSPATSSIQAAAASTSAARTRPHISDSASSSSHQITGYRATAGPHDADRQTPGIIGSIDEQVHSPLSGLRSDHGTAMEDVALYEQPLDMEFPLNFDDSARRKDYSGHGDALDKQFALLDDEFWRRIRAMQPPVDADITLSTYITGRARAANPAHPKPTRLCFATRMETGHGHRVHEIHALKLQLIEEYFPKTDFPELYPLILRYFMNYGTLFGSKAGEEAVSMLG